MPQSIDNLWYAYLTGTLSVNTSTVSNMLATYLGGEGYVGTVDDKLKAFLTAQGHTGDINSAMKAWLGGKGYVGSLQDRLAASLAAGDTLTVV